MDAQYSDPKEKSHCEPSKVQRDTKVSSICIFSYDGTDRIRFTGQGYQAFSQPDASGSPKMDSLCDLK